MAEAIARKLNKPPQLARTAWRSPKGEAADPKDYTPGGVSRGLTGKELRGLGLGAQADEIEEEERKRKAAEAAAKAAAETAAVQAAYTGGA